jgi:hypothetical protein
MRTLAIKTNTCTAGLLMMAALVMVPGSALAQIPVPETTPGVVGTIGLDGTIDKFYSDTQRAIVKTADGVRHVVLLGRHTVVHGNTSSDKGLATLEEGSHVVVHYVEEGNRNTAVEIDRIGDGALTSFEGTVTRIDRAAKKLTVHLADGSSVTLRLSDRAARDVGKDVTSGGRVIVLRR